MGEEIGKEGVREGGKQRQREGMNDPVPMYRIDPDQSYAIDMLYVSMSMSYCTAPVVRFSPVIRARPVFCVKKSAKVQTRRLTTNTLQEDEDESADVVRMWEQREQRARLADQEADQSRYDQHLDIYV